MKKRSVCGAPMQSVGGRVSPWTIWMGILAGMCIVGCSGGVVNVDPSIQGGTTPNAGGTVGGSFVLPDSGLSTGGTKGGGGGGSTSGCGVSDAQCQVKKPEGCGDGINNQAGSEQCDDGNTVPGDGCSGACTVEPNWECPPAGACTRKVTCGDGAIGPGEVCDDRNTVDGDGCNASCTMQDPAFHCVAGSACTRISECGNARIEAGENCDDGNKKDNDGCSSACQLQKGYVCPKPGTACKPEPTCGDGVVNASLGEICDDGNRADNDGCSGTCKAKGLGCICVPGKLCQCPKVACGDGTIGGDEKCDDGNATPDDGCSGTCTIERGYACPFTGAPCVPSCGDGIVLSPMEQCDPAEKGTNVEKACSTTCRWNEGWVCTGSPPSCRQTKCGDGKIEGTEACDDGNTTPGDGCSPACRFEPTCSAATGTCTSKCGDGIVMPAQPDSPILPGGACDDGNANAGDGCAADCKVEVGFQCQQPPMTAATTTVPIVYRDFAFGEDFEITGATGKNLAVAGLVKNQLGPTGKPVANGVYGGDGYITSAASFEKWYTDVPGVNTTYKSTLLLHNNGRGGYVNWWKDDKQYQGYSNIRWCSDTACANCNPPAYVPGPNSVCLSPCTAWAGSKDTCAADVVLFEGNPLFFPLDAVAGMITPASQLGPATLPPSYGGWVDEPGKPLHNFSFTSEVRTWFGYVASKRYELDFTGDDDVWVFINRRLAVDLGGIHTPVNGKIVLNDKGGGTVSITPTDGPKIALPDGTQGFATTTSTVDLGMQSGGVYEMAVFQAERRTNASTYKLTLSGFNDAPSLCKPICGDAKVSPGEQCDNGTDKNLGGYNQCTDACLLGPYCGDGVKNGPEECDDGKNTSEYGLTSGCAPGCTLPARCGDGVVQTQYDESCDDGPANLATTDENAAYGGKCMSTCRLGGYCGDGKKNGAEQCDDGKNDGTYGTCGADCIPAPRCLDGVVQKEYGEECEPSMSNDPECTNACRFPGGCGDGIVQRQDGEQCDDGTPYNTGVYGGCAPSCIYAPHCGDGVKNGPEECDMGKDLNTGEYGGCTSVCKLGPHCGDGVKNGPEECDDGDLNESTDSTCSKACKKMIFIVQ